MEVLKGFYVLEGLDGAGTTTQMRLVCEALRRRGRKVLSTCEPTTGPVGLLIKRVLRGEIPSTADALACLYAADRENHLHLPLDGIVARLDDGWTVVSDRYFFSSYAYQAVDVPFERVLALNGGFPCPEAVVFIDTPTEECLRRISARGQDREIFEQASILAKVRENYERAFALLPPGARLFRFDGRLPQEEILSQILNKVFAL